MKITFKTEASHVSTMPKRTPFKYSVWVKP